MTYAEIYAPDIPVRTQSIMTHTDSWQKIASCRKSARYLAKKIRDNIRQFPSDPDILAAGPQLIT